MKHKLIILITLLSISLYTSAQEYRITKSAGQLKLNITGVIIEGYEGKEIIFSGQKVVSDEQDERAKGLVPITSSKYIDNTGLGINVTESEGIVNVNLVAKKPIGVLTIKVPNSIKVAINNNTSINRVFFSYNNLNEVASSANSKNNNTKGEDEIVIKNLKNELEVSVYWNKIRLENNSGPMNIKTVSGSVDAIFTGEVKGPISIISVNSYVDVTLPATTKANIEMGSSYGKLYAGKEFKIDYEKLEPEKVAQRLIASTNRVNGTVTTRQRGTDDEVAVVAYGTTTTTTKGKEAETKEKATKEKATKESGIQVVDGPVYVSYGTQGVAGTVTGTHATPMTIFPSAYSSGDRIKGKLNGGGVDLIFKSTNKNVYLRQP